MLLASYLHATVVQHAMMLCGTMCAQAAYRPLLSALSALHSVRGHDNSTASAWYPHAYCILKPQCICTQLQSMLISEVFDKGPHLYLLRHRSHPAFLQVHKIPITAWFPFLKTCILGSRSRV